MGSKVLIEIPGEVIHSTRMTPEDLKRELAIHLFEQGKLSFGKAREMAGMTVWAFQQLLGSREISVHYGRVLAPIKNSPFSTIREFSP